MYRQARESWFEFFFLLKLIKYCSTPILYWKEINNPRKVSGLQDTDEC